MALEEGDEDEIQDVCRLLSELGEIVGAAIASVTTDCWPGTFSVTWPAVAQ